jgi:hypothetical protein
VRAVEKGTVSENLCVSKAEAGCPISRVLCEKWGFSPAPSQPSTSAPANSLLPPSPVVDPNQSRFSVGIGSVATPPPIFRASHQSAHHRIAMHVPQLLHLFLLAPEIEIIETTLPEPAGEFARDGQPPGDAQLHRLNYLRGIAIKGSEISRCTCSGMTTYPITANR